MNAWLENTRNMRGPILLILLLTLTFVSDINATENISKISFQTSSSLQPSNTAPYQWIKVLQSTERFQIILIDKASQTVEVLESESGSITNLDSYDCATGENFGQKIRSGDLKTPEGIYFITQSFTDNKISIFGKRAFHLDYPNVFDKSEERNGDGIYIHGTNKKLVPNSTNGCITMQNQDLDLLAKLLIEHNTPIIIVNDKRELQTLSINLSGIGQNTILSLLVPDEISLNDLTIHNLFVISNGTQNVAVGKFLVSSNNYPHKTVFSRVYLNKNENGNWIIDKRVFRGPMVRIEPIQKKIQIAKVITNVRPENQKIQTAISIRKKIQIAEATDNAQPKRKKIQIARAVNKAQPERKKIQTPKAVNKAQPEQKQILTVKAASNALPEREEIQIAKAVNNAQPENQKKSPTISNPKTKDQILKFIEKWRQAWQYKQLDDYIECYAENFQQGQKDLKAWRKHKQNLNRRYKTIRVTVDDIKIDWQKNGATVHFHQVYKSDKFHADGNKLLVLNYTDEKGWKILKEIWQN